LAVEQGVKNLTTVPLLEGLSPDELNELMTHVEVKNYETGDVVFLQGDPGGALLIVASGTVELYIYDENQVRIVLSQVKAGGFFGEVSLFDKGERTANAMATEATEILILRQAVMVNFLRAHPDTAIHMINILSLRLRENTALITTNKDRNAFDMLQAQRSSIIDRIADRLSRVVGSWRYLLILMIVIVLWMVLNISQLLGQWDRPIEFNVLNLTITILGALQLPLILMAQQRQDDYAKIVADLEYQVNLKAQLSILEVNRKLDWLKDTLLLQSTRLDKLETNLVAIEKDLVVIESDVEQIETEVSEIETGVEQLTQEPK